MKQSLHHKQPDTHHKAKPILQVDFPDPSVSFEELLHVPLPGVWAQVADEDATTTHCYLTRVEGKKIWLAVIQERNKEMLTVSGRPGETEQTGPAEETHSCSSPVFHSKPQTSGAFKRACFPAGGPSTTATLSKHSRAPTCTMAAPYPQTSANPHQPTQFGDIKEGSDYTVKKKPTATLKTNEALQKRLKLDYNKLTNPPFSIVVRYDALYQIATMCKV